MTCKPNTKPLVLGWLNPLANGRLTIKQNKTKQDKAGFGSLNQNQNPPNVLVGQPIKQGFFSCFFSLRALENAKIRALQKMFSTGFQQSFPQSGELGVKA